MAINSKLVVDEYIRNIPEFYNDEPSVIPDLVILKYASTSFDDVKHMLYKGVKYIAFDLNGRGDGSELRKLYDYCKQRFPEKIFNSVEAAEMYDADAAAEAISFADFKLNSDGLIPCIAQDYKTGEVLMMAWMNEKSYNKTLETGLMTYWSRSRSKLWTKGEESGHFQHMISLIIDCDKDTILAKVRQEGPACHTGNPTCFFTPIVEGEKSASIRNVLEDVYKVIADRKVNPKEGSYTNYLFDSGVDKILKKVGEEATEIVIAAKNPDNSEIKYEIADFLYHAMVLMAEKGVTWDEIADELARRE